MALPPSQKDTFGPPKPGRNLSDLSALVRHQRRNLGNLDPGMLGGHWASTKPVDPNSQPDDVGGDADGGDAGTDEILFENTDQYLITGSGDVEDWVLKHIPINDGATSLQVFWLPNRLPRDSWSIADNVLRVTDPGWRKDDLLECAYAYEYDGEQEPSDIVPDADFASSTGWEWLQVPPNPNLDYNDPVIAAGAGWVGGAAPFGQTTPEHKVGETFEAGWPDYATTWEQTTRMWARRTIVVEPGIPVQISMRFNRAITLFWNGFNRGTTTGSSGEAIREIPADLVLASNLVLFKIVDDAFTGHFTGCYFDAQISQSVEEAPL